MGVCGVKGRMGSLMQSKNHDAARSAMFIAGVFCVSIVASHIPGTQAALFGLSAPVFAAIFGTCLAGLPTGGRVRLAFLASVVSIVGVLSWVEVAANRVSFKGGVHGTLLDFALQYFPGGVWLIAALIHLLPLLLLLLGTAFLRKVKWGWVGIPCAVVLYTFAVYFYPSLVVSDPFIALAGAPFGQWLIESFGYEASVAFIFCLGVVVAVRIRVGRWQVLGVLVSAFVLNWLVEGAHKEGGGVPIGVLAYHQKVSSFDDNEPQVEEFLVKGLEKRVPDLALIPESFNALNGFSNDDEQTIRETERVIESVGRQFDVPFVYVTTRDAESSRSALIDAHFVSPRGERVSRRKAYLIPFVEHDGWRSAEARVRKDFFTINGRNIFVAICFEMWSPMFVSEIRSAPVDLVVVLSSLDVFQSKYTSIPYRQVLFQTWIRAQVIAKAAERPVLVVLKSGEVILALPHVFERFSESMYEKRSYTHTKLRLSR